MAIFQMASAVADHTIESLDHSLQMINQNTRNTVLKSSFFATVKLDGAGEVLPFIFKTAGTFDIVLCRI